MIAFQISPVSHTESINSGHNLGHCQFRLAYSSVNIPVEQLPSSRNADLQTYLLRRARERGMEGEGRQNYCYKESV